MTSSRRGTNEAGSFIWIQHHANTIAKIVKVNETTKLPYFDFIILPSPLTTRQTFVISFDDVKSLLKSAFEKNLV